MATAGTPAAVRPGAPLDVLLIGPDGAPAASGTGREYGGADTAILCHLSGDRTNETVLSIRGDLVTTVPDCPVRQRDGSIKVVPGAHDVPFATSLGRRGAIPAARCAPWMQRVRAAETPACVT